MYSYSPGFQTADEATGHTVIVYGKPQQNGANYWVNVCDPNGSSPEKILVQPSGNTISAVFYNEKGRPCKITRCKFESSFTNFDSPYIDIDGDDNTSAQAENEEFYSGKSIIAVQANAGFTVTDSDGRIFHYENGEVAGDLPILGESFFAYGEDIPAKNLFLVPQSSQFTCTTDDGSELLDFYVINGSKPVA